ncbi:MAG: ABC transporter ATP-binding protein [Armatimonadota bacterium]
MSLPTVSESQQRTNALPRIVVEGVAKRFILPHEKVMSFKEALVGVFKRSRGADEFWALRDVSFSVPEGQTVALIGANGSGKTSLLRLIAGILRPTRGKIQTHGTLAALFELGAGFHPELSGRDNIFLNGVLMGRTRKEIQARLDDIIEFSELGDFIETPIKNYSAGMRLRLSFSVAVMAEADILLIDEVIAVGDEHFQHKCLRTIAELQTQGRTILVVSHDLPNVRRIANRVLWLENGVIRMDGDAETVVDAYVAANQ